MTFDLEKYGISPAGVDAVLPFSVEGLDVRGRALVLGPAINRILEGHDYPAPVSRLLAEAVVLTALLGTTLKFNGRFTLQTQTDGPISMLVVDFTAPDAIRAYARYDEDAFAEGVETNAIDSASLLGHGHLAMTIDQGAYMQRYQGLVELDGISLEEVARRYFERSEQIPSDIRLAVGEIISRGEEGEEPKRAWTAGGIFLQFLPEAGERVRHQDLHPGDAPEGVDIPEVDQDDAWVEAQSLLGTVKPDELVDPEITVERLLYRLFHERGVRVYDPQPVAPRCRCSREKVEGVLSTFSKEDMADMTVDGKVVVTCEFCGTKYEFDGADNS